MLPFPVLGFEAWDGYDLVLFSDVGNVWLLAPAADATSDQEPWVSLYKAPLRYAAGVGVRVITPIGPLRVDVAANPQAALGAASVRSLLTETWGEPTVRIHVSLGSL
jgi:outer membrane protein assembly factor BamA